MCVAGAMRIEPFIAVSPVKYNISKIVWGVDNDSNSIMTHVPAAMYMKGKESAEKMANCLQAIILLKKGKRKK